jgi:four helix bundle protein
LAIWSGNVNHPAPKVNPLGRKPRSAISDQRSAISYRLKAKDQKRKLMPAAELEYHLLLSHDLEFINDYDYENLSKETVVVKQMLTSFIKKLKADR